MFVKNITSTALYKLKGFLITKWKMGFFLKKEEIQKQIKLKYVYERAEYAQNTDKSGLNLMLSRALAYSCCNFTYTKSFLEIYIRLLGNHNHV